MLFVELVVLDNGDGERATHFVNVATVRRLKSENGDTATTITFNDGSDEVYDGSLSDTMKKINEARITNR